ncbi:MAG: hypothetical protein IJI73_00965 [Kiritimatiellae bacterium]|nr:hypothetical protein [Kiritimatiellia bacterium]
MKTHILAAAAIAALSASAGFRDALGPNVRVFSPSDDPAEVRRVAEELFKKQHHSQFGPNRYALLFLPGDYVKAGTFNVGYYTQLLGLGRTPDEVKLCNVKTPAALPDNNATCNFWVGIENVEIVDTDRNDDPFFGFQWAVSQAAPARRLLVGRKAVFDWFYGWASGGYVADTIFRKPAGSHSQQQYYYRNDTFEQGDYGINWNKVVQGSDGRTGTTNWRQGGSATFLQTTPVIREKPFLFVDGDALKVFVPALRRDARGTSWKPGEMGRGRTLDVVRDFHVAVAGRDTAKTVNAALAAGRNVLFTPGVYRVEEPVRVAKAGAVVLGIGEATLVPENPDAALVCADVDDITVAGLVFDAERASRRFVVVGERKGGASHAAAPTVLHDLVYRVGGTGRPGKTEVALEINSNDVIVDQTWIWRADHGDHTGWRANTSRNGIVVNGDRVTCYGLFVEHFQEHDVLWNGEDGRTFFLQNEKCYDPPGNAVWMSHGGKKKGYAAYKVADGVSRHYATGLGVYDVFINTDGNSVFLDDAIEVPDAPGVVVENACIVEIAKGDGPLVGINHIVNGHGHGIRTGKGSGGGYAVQRVYRYCNGSADVADDYYAAHKGK